MSTPRAALTCFSTGVGAGVARPCLRWAAPCCRRRCSDLLLLLERLHKAAFRRLVCSTLSAFFWLDAIQFSHMMAPLFSSGPAAREVCLYCTQQGLPESTTAADILLRV